MKKEISVWNGEETVILQNMRAQKRSFDEIASALKRTRTSVKERWRWINLSAQGKINRREGINSARRDRGNWTEAQVDQLMFLRDKYLKSWTEISKIMERPSGTLYSKYYFIKDGSRDRDRKIGIQVSSEAVADRNYRNEIQPRDLTAILMGDPKPGYSALERRT